MNQFGPPSNKRDFDMAMGFDPSNSYQMGNGMPPHGMNQAGPAGAMGQQPTFFFPQQMGMPFNPHMAGQMSMPPMQMPGFDPQHMQYMAPPPRYYSSANAVPVAEPAKEPAPKSNADWALEKRRARNRITAAESRRKCKEEIQNLRDELLRLKEEKQEKEDLIDYYRNRYEKFESGAEGAKGEGTVAPAPAPDADASSTVEPKTETETETAPSETVEAPASDSAAPDESLNDPDDSDDYSSDGSIEQ